MSNNGVITPDLIKAIQQGYSINWNGIHGIDHFQRVRDNGLKLSALTGANPSIVELFAFLHDSKRLNDAWDPGHGARSAGFVRELNGSLFYLEKDELELLAFACEHHTDGLIEGDITVQTCWDSDRLDLWRVARRPQPARLCTEAARSKEMIEWAMSRIP